jgi:hypothetical protein
MRGLQITVCCRQLPVRGMEGVQLLPDSSAPGGRTLVTTLLEEAGHRVTQVEDGPIDRNPGDVLLMLGNASWFRTICRQLATLERSRRPLTVIWQSEALPPPRASALPRPRLQFRELAKIALRDARAGDVYTNRRRLQWLARHGLPDVMLTSSRVGQEFLTEEGIRADWVPFGFHPAYGGDLQLDRDIDVLFLGTMKVRRRRRLISRIRGAGISVMALGSWHDPALWGEGRTRLLNRAKILLNIARMPGQFSGLRLMLGMANRSLVVSEPIYLPEPYVPGEHFITADPHELPAAITDMLSDVDRRARVVEQGHRLVTQEVTLERSVRRILELIEARMDVG